MTFIRRLMEIKEEQLKNEITARIARYHILNTLTEILKMLKKGQFMFLNELKGGKDGKNKNKRNK